LNSTGCSLKKLVERVGMQAAKWANHRDGNFALGALLEKAPMWFAYKVYHELHVAAKETGNLRLLCQLQKKDIKTNKVARGGGRAFFCIALEKTEGRLSARAHAAVNFKAATMHKSLRRTQSTSALSMW